MARADSNEKAGRFGKALVDLDALVEMHPEIDNLLQRRGMTRFFHGDMKGAIADFDKYLKNHPSRAPHHWQRGIAYYYAGEFEKGVKQFEIHQDVNSNDVENAVWHFLCKTKIDGFEAARESLIPIVGDSRVPMAEVQKLFAGELKPEGRSRRRARRRPCCRRAQEQPLLRPPLPRAVLGSQRRRREVAGAHPQVGEGLRDAALHGRGRPRASAGADEEVGVRVCSGWGFQVPCRYACPQRILAIGPIPSS